MPEVAIGEADLGLLEMPRTAVPGNHWIMPLG